MRVLIGFLVMLALAFGHSPADASCAPPAPLAENAARAVAVVYGRVASEGAGTVTLTVDRVLKGTASSPLVVFLGPGRAAPGGPMVFTSVDYNAELGTDHVLYLIRGADGQLETSACIGSHAGSPTTEELAFFGAGASPAPATPATQSQATPAQVPSEAPVEVRPSTGVVTSLWPGLLVLALAGAAGLIVVTRVLLRRS